MSLQLTSQQVWQAIEKELFAVLGFVTEDDEARTVGIVYVVHDHKIYITTGKETWKARHIRCNPNVSLTIPVAKRVPIMPWIKIPAATITFSGTASVQDAKEVDPVILHALMRGAESDLVTVETLCVIAVEPQGEFITYGIGVPLMTMRTPEKARGRAPVA